jgi:DNA polymerase III delta subunit
MMYLFFGNNRDAISEYVSHWKKQFEAKYGWSQIFHFKNSHELDIQDISAILLGRWIFSEKKMILLDGIVPSTKTSKNDNSSLQSWLIKNEQEFNEWNVVIFVISQIDKRWSFYKYFHKKSKENSKKYSLKDFSCELEHEKVRYLQQRIPSANPRVLSELLKLKGWSIEKTISECTKLSILQDPENWKIDYIREIIYPEWEESIFEYINSLLYKKPKDASVILKQLLSQSDTMSIYYSILANLRLTFYIVLYLKSWAAPNKINSELKLGNRSFLIQKYSGLPYAKVSKLYEKFIEIDIKMKSWAFHSMIDDPVKNELECITISKA